ncbi:MAG: hypothetical protein EA417_17930 [Gammaproteobacteria bacterium]|nr:MAG: hypothetical protein EA417_17930 [Gammaproteobacteria bacterium]
MNRDVSERLKISRGEKPRFHDDPAVDDLMTMVTALSCEVAVLRERVDTHERLAERQLGCAPETVESFSPNESEQIERAQLRQALIDSVFRPLVAGHQERRQSPNAAVVDKLEHPPSEK